MANATDEKPFFSAALPLHLEDLETKHSPLWWQTAGKSYTASGYGRKIPASTMVRIQKHWRRVYVTIYGNAGTAWIVLNGERQIVD